jgi:hypothetical protein
MVQDPETGTSAEQSTPESEESPFDPSGRTSSLNRHGASWLKFIGWIYLAFPLTYTSFIGLLFDVPVGKLFGLFLTPSFYLLNAFAIATGYFLFFNRRWAWQLSVATHILIIFYTLSILLKMAETHHPFSAFLFSAAMVGLLTWLLRSELKKPYIVPRIRWWESDYDQEHVIPVKVTFRDQEYEGELMDLSVDGAFIKMGQWPACEEAVHLSFEVYHKKLALDGVTVWLAEDRVVHPKGIGVKFLPMDRQARRRLKLAAYRIERALGLRNRKSLSAREIELQRYFRLQTKRLQRKLPPTPSGISTIVARIKERFDRS